MDEPASVELLAAVLETMSLGRNGCYCISSNRRLYRERRILAHKALITSDAEAGMEAALRQGFERREAPGAVVTQLCSRWVISISPSSELDAVCDETGQLLRGVQNRSDRSQEFLRALPRALRMLSGAGRCDARAQGVHVCINSGERAKASLHFAQDASYFCAGEKPVPVQQLAWCCRG